MNRSKLTVLASVMILAVAGLSWAGPDDDTPLGKVMGGVNKNDIIITKGVRNAANFNKSQKQVKEAADALVKLAKDAKADDCLPPEAKKDEALKKKYADYADDFAKKSQEFATYIEKEKNAANAKAAYNKFKVTCNNCHKDFRKEDE